MYTIQFKEEALLPRERLLAVGAEKTQQPRIIGHSHPDWNQK